MDAQRLDLLASDVNDYVFVTMDNEFDWTGDEAGRVAHLVEQAFRRAVLVAEAEADERFIVARAKATP